MQGSNRSHTIPRSRSETVGVLLFWLTLAVVAVGTVVSAYMVAAAAVRMISQQLGLPM